MRGWWYKLATSVIQTQALLSFDKEFSSKQDTEVLYCSYTSCTAKVSCFEVGDDKNQMARSIFSALEFSKVFCFLLGKRNTLFWELVLNTLDLAPSVIKTVNWNEFQLSASEEWDGAGK